MYRKKFELLVGQKWRVDVDVCNSPDKLVSESIWHEFYFEMELIGELINQARTVARDYEVASHPMEWFTIKDRVAVILKDDPADSYLFRTDEEAMNKLVLDTDQTFHPWFCDDSRLGVLDYLAKWECHIPEAESKDYYRGLCRGFCVALRMCVAVAKLPPRPTELGIREELFLYLASKSAEHGISRDLPPLSFPTARPVVPVSEVIRRKVVKPFRVGSAEIERSASMVDERFLSKKTPIEGIGPEAMDPEAATMSQMEPGERSSFYAGVVHAMSVSERIATLYEVEIIPTPVLDTLPLDQGLHPLCCVAAHYWAEISH